MAKIMELVKKNMVSIICAVIALAAVGAVFWPISGYYTELQGTADERKKVYDKLKGLADNKSRTLPITEVGSVTTAVPLEQFPNRTVIDAWRKVTDQMKLESDQMFTSAVEMNRKGHDVIAGVSIPTAKQFDFDSFRSEYRKLMDISTPEARANSLLGKILNVGTVPTNQEIDKRKKDVEDELKKGGDLLVLPREEQNRFVERKKAQVQDELRQKVADDIKVYARFDQNGPMTVQPELSRTATAQPLDYASAMFRAQVMTWVEQDVLNALARANGDSKSVKTSAVKYLANLRILENSMQQFNTGSSATPGAAPIPAPTTEPSQELKKSPLISMSGRYYNGVYDVIRFNLKILVDAEQVPRVLQELSRNQFITVNNVSMQVVDVARWQADGYFFGDKPMVQLDILGEELLLRKWTVPLMPKGVKVALGLEQPDAAPTPPPPPQ